MNETDLWVQQAKERGFTEVPALDLEKALERAGIALLRPPRNLQVRTAYAPRWAVLCACEGVRDGRYNVDLIKTLNADTPAREAFLKRF